MQYTIRQVPPVVDKTLRDKAHAAGKSLNQFLLDLISGVTERQNQPKTYHDLDKFIATWVDDPSIDEALTAQRKIEPGDWA